MPFHQQKTVTPVPEKPVRLEELVREKGYFDKCVSEVSLTSFSVCHKIQLSKSTHTELQENENPLGRISRVCLVLMSVPKGDKMVTRIEEWCSG